MPKPSLGKNPANCMCMAEKIIAVITIEYKQLILFSIKLFCMRPLNSISSPTAGNIAITKMLINKSLNELIIKNLSDYFSIFLI